MTDDASFQARLAETARRTEAALDLAITTRDIPERLRGALKLAALGGGKRLRPFLLVETARLFDVPAERAIVAATALECVHCYSLVHDDLPAMDDDDMRRGQPTVHKAYDEATAILAGDGLLTLAFELLGEEACDPDPAIRCRLVTALARASGVAGMVAGQALDLAAEGRYAADGRPLALTVDAIIALQALKTGALIRFAVEAGCLLGRAGGTETDALLRYADGIGRAFQIADDLLDAEGTAVDVGKATGKDQAAGKATLVGLLGRAAARGELNRLVADAENALEMFGQRAATLRAGLRFVAERRS